MATFTVTTEDDVVDANDGVLSLREALTLANANADSDEIEFAFASSKSMTVRLLLGELSITNDVLINGDRDGDGDADIVLSGDIDNSGTLNNADSRIFNISGTGTDVDLNGLTLTNGYIYGGNGGAIFVGTGVNSLDVTNSTLENSRSAYDAGNFVGGYGGAIGTSSVANTTITITNTTVRNNTGDNAGGGIFSAGALTVTGSTISGNTATANYGGGIKAGSNNVIIDNSTIDGNTAGIYGGGIDTDFANLTITNSTITANTAIGGGGGIRTGAGATETLTINNSVLALNTGTTPADLFVNDSAATISASNSFFETDVSAELDTNTNNIIASGTLGLGALQNNGGPVQTRAILPNSDLIDAGDNALAGGLATDANGDARIVAGNVDIGAREFPLFVTTLTDVVDATDNFLSLREALVLANADAGADTITFAVSGQIRLSNLGVLSISSDVTIDGGAGITINGDVDASGTANSADSQIFSISGTGTDAVLNDLTLTRGYVYGTDGGAIYVQSGTRSLTVSNSTVENSVSVYDFTTTYDGGKGGGIGTDGAADTTAITIIDSTIRNNTALYGGGGIYTDGTLTVTRSTISGNQSFSGNGGGIYTDRGDTNIINSTIDGNTSGLSGGGIHSFAADLTITNSTITANTADDGGGISKSSITGGNNDSITINNSVLALNTGTSSNADLNLPAATVVSANSSFFETDVSADLDTNIGNIFGGTLGLGALTNNGGPVQTRAIEGPSDLIDAGDTALVIGDSDAAGNIRVQGAAVDIGATESRGDIVVDTLVDENDGDFSAGNLSLREAIENSGTGGSATITFASSLQGGTLMLTQGELDIDADLSITGDITIDADNESQIFDVDDNVSLTLDGLSLTNGYTSGDGGAIEIDVNATLDFRNGSITNSYADEDGGAIYGNDDSTITITNSTLSGNIANGAGGAIYANSDITIVVSNSTISNNFAQGDGGGLATDDGSMTITGSTISGNFASGDGGGMYADEVKLIVADSTISNNIAGGVGGGIYFYEEDTLGASSITNTTIYGNTSLDEGGGIYNAEGDLLIQNSTISGNRAVLGGGIANDDDSSTTTLISTIVAGNSAANSFMGNDLSSDSRNSPDTDTFLSGGNNLIGDRMFAGEDMFVEQASDIVGTTGAEIDPMLGALADNGGPTMTLALLSGSQAIDSGSNSAMLSTDQRGTQRDLGGTDIGAFETFVSDVDLVVDVLRSRAFGNNFAGATQTGDTVRARFENEAGGDVILRVDGFDIDTDVEAQLLFNGSSVGFFDEGTDDGLTAYSFVLPEMNATGFENLLEFQQAANPAFKWGVANFLLELADFTLVDKVQESGAAGNFFEGTTDADGILTATFIGSNTDRVLNFRGFDIDTATEVELLLNGSSLGFLDAGVNDGLADYSFTIDAADQQSGGNLIEFRQATNPAFKWGITDVLLIDTPDFVLTDGIVETGEFGQNFNGAMDADGVVSGTFISDGDGVVLSLNGFDIDKPDEVEVLLNGNSVGFLETGVNNGEASYSFVIPGADQQDGTNLIEFRQTNSPTFKWGVTDVLVEASDFTLVPGTTDTREAGNQFNGATDADGNVTAIFAQTETDLRLDFRGFDIDTATEVELLLNGTSLGFIDAGMNNGLASYSIDIAATDQQEGGNLIEFRQANAPTFKWGITDVLLSLDTDFDLSVGTTETGEFGQSFNGATAADGIVSASFTGTGGDRVLSFDGFDIDTGEELEILLNGDSLGFVDAGVNNGLAPYEVAIAAADQTLGENLLEFRQATNPAFKWGITDIALSLDLTVGTAETGKFGQNFEGATAADGLVPATFTGTGEALVLSFDGFDIDTGSELEIFVNGDSLGFVDAGVNNGLESYEVSIAAADQTMGENTLEFRQASSPTFKWGVTDILLSRDIDFDLSLGTTETGKFGNKFDGVTDKDGIVAATFAGTDDDLLLSFDGFDIDTASELEIFVNGATLGFVGAGVDNGLQSYDVVIAAADQTMGENLIEFRQANSPTFKWGVTDILLDDLIV